MQTYYDTILHLIDYLGGAISDQAVRDCKRAIVSAQREINAAHNWTYLYRQGRVNLNGVATNLTLSSQAVGGVAPNIMTLDSGTWPPSVLFCAVRVGTVNYVVQNQISSTVIQLDPEFIPQSDYPPGTSFSIYQDEYLLPADWIAQDMALYEKNFGGMQYVHPRDWNFANRYIFNTGIPQCFSIIGDSRFPNRMTMRVFPFPTESKTLDFLYKRAPRPLGVPLLSGASASISSGSAAVSGGGSGWTSNLAGCVLRISGNAQAPTAWNDVNPPAFEGIVHSVTDATNLVVTAYPEGQLVSASGPWTISDPIDLDEFSMLNAFLRCCERQISMSRVLKDKPSATKQYLEALSRAKDADSRTFAGRHEGEGTRLNQRMRDMPLLPGVSE